MPLVNVKNSIWPVKTCVIDLQSFSYIAPDVGMHPIVMVAHFCANVGTTWRVQLNNLTLLAGSRQINTTV